jgi:hypothetical protein
VSEVAALQAVLAGEHAAVYGYGVVGAHLRGAAQRRAAAAEAGHRARRDVLRDLLLARRATPVAAAAAYRLPRPVTSAAEAVALAVLLEERLGAVWADAVGDLTGALRALAARTLQDTAVRAAAWRGASVAFPGLPERAG